MIETLSSHIWPSEDISVIISVTVIFLFAGIVKGFLGIGLPSAAMAFLTLVMDPTKAISLLTLPIIFTNFLQFTRCEDPIQIAKKYWLFAIAIMMSIFITSFFILSYPKALLTMAIGIAMVFFSLTQMFNLRLNIKDGYGWHIGVGLFAGVLGGLSSIWSPPVAMFLLARNICKSEFIGATGFMFLAGSLPLAAGLSFAGILTTATILKSLVGLIVVLFGFRVGEVLRDFAPQGVFRTIVLWAFLIMGARLIANGLF